MGLVSPAAVNLLLTMQAAQDRQAAVSDTVRDDESGARITISSSNPPTPYLLALSSKGGMP